MEGRMIFDNYTRPADFCTLIILGLYMIMLHSTYTVKHKNLALFKLAVGILFLAAVSNICFHDYLRGHSDAEPVFLYLFRHIYYLALIISYSIFDQYIVNLILPGRRAKSLLEVLIIGGTAVFTVLELLSPITQFGFYTMDGHMYEDYFVSPYRVSYIYNSLLTVYLLVWYRRKFITKMHNCLMSCMFISLMTMAVQSYAGETSYTVISYTFPIMVVLFLFHYNSYDKDTGTLDEKAFDAYIEEHSTRSFTLICLYLQDMHLLQKRGISEEFFHFSERYFKAPCTFRVRDDRMYVAYEDSRNKDASERMPAVLDAFYDLYDHYQMPYKIVMIHSNEKMQTGYDYTSLNEFVEKRIALNTIYECKEKDVTEYLKSRYILSELADISRKKDLNDPRVKVYCQPILNARSHTYTSAEALMRLELPKTGIVFPDQFIHLAEDNDYIHDLSLIILNKTCQYVNQLDREGYLLDRISVNFSVQELRDKRFCEDVIEIIRGNNIYFGKIAMELTESRNDSDFDNVRRVMARLRMLGMKFYLDDFGTGYSSIERIICLPIDIIKFDRSLTFLAGRDAESRFMVESFSDIFMRSNYQILFEGVENEKDEEHCIEMNALYLQGYKYSRPIPMERLKNFLRKAG